MRVIAMSDAKRLVDSMVSEIEMYFSYAIALSILVFFGSSIDIVTEWYFQGGTLIVTSIILGWVLHVLFLKKKVRDRWEASFNETHSWPIKSERAHQLMLEIAELKGSLKVMSEDSHERQRLLSRIGILTADLGKELNTQGTQEIYE